jgi:hypothetical protein
LLPYVKNLEIFKKKSKNTGEGRDAGQSYDMLSEISQEMTNDDFRFVCENLKYLYLKAG